MRQAVGERRPVVEHVLRGAVAAGDAGPEGVVAGPVVEDLELECREVGCSAGQLGYVLTSALSVTMCVVSCAMRFVH